MEKINKLINIFKKEGFFGFIRKVFLYFKANYLPHINIFEMIDFIVNKKKYDNEISGLLSSDSFDRIITWRSSFGWNVELFQRPQHIATNLAGNRSLVLYETTMMTDKVKTFEVLKDNLILVNFQNKLFAKHLFKKIKETSYPRYIQLYSTDWKMSRVQLEELIADGYKVIYEYIDDIHPALSGTKTIPKSITEKYDFAMENSDIYVVTTADLLYEDVFSKRGSKNLIFSSNGVDYDFFQSFDENYIFEDEFLEIINNGKINLGYYGALAVWFDYDLIKRINELDKYNIILFGIKYDESFEKSGINDLKNVYFMGAKDYFVLKNYANKIDVLTIPFLINDITKATSPVKLFEYMALKKPILTTPMNECKKYKSVLIAEDHDSFIEKLELACNLKNNIDYIDLLDKEAFENSWKSKTLAIVEAIKNDE